jgi:DNA polymerase-3 subunit delta
VRAVVGADSYLAEHAIETLVAGWIGDDRQDALEVLRGEEVRWPRVLDACRSLSLFAPRRAVVVRRADAIKGETGAVAEYVEAPTDGVLLVLQFTKLDKRTALHKRLDKRKAVTPAEPLKGRKLRERVSRELEARNLSLGPDALDALIEHVGQDLRRLVGELDKLAALGLPARAGREQVAEVLGRGIARPRWELSDALAARKAERALHLIEQLLDEGEYAPLILGTLHRSLRRVRTVRALAESRVSQGEIAARALIPPFRVRDEIQLARSWPPGGLERAFGALDAADRRLKTGGDPRVALAVAVLEVCGGGGARRRAAR